MTPYTDQRLVELARSGVRRLLVACPAFVADNLETLEEIGIQGRQSFIDAGGEELTLVPCLNTNPDWVAALSGWCSGSVAVGNSAEADDKVIVRSA